MYKKYNIILKRAVAIISLWLTACQIIANPNYIALGESAKIKNSTNSEPHLKLGDNITSCHLQTNVIDATIIAFARQKVKLAFVEKINQPEICTSKNLTKTACEAKSTAYLREIIGRDIVKCDVIANYTALSKGHKNSDLRKSNSTIKIINQQQKQDITYDYHAICYTKKFILNEEMVKAGWLKVPNFASAKYKELIKQLKR